jgi:proline dehydrogenase
MLRSLLISLSKADWARRMITHWGPAWRMASRFVAGERLEDAIRVVRELNANGILTTLDPLGEHTTSPEDARQSTQDILSILDEIERSGVRSGVSIKLSQIGLSLDQDLCRQNLELILQKAQADHNFVRIDMEETAFTQQTVDLYQQMRAKGYENTGLVIQAYLYRSQADVRHLAESKTRVRLVKGAYMEPSDVAFPRKADVDDNFDRLAEMLMDTCLAAGQQALSMDGKTPPIAAIATHDEKRITHAREYAQKIGLNRQALEFQMLYGIRRSLQEQLAKEGYPVRVYVPFGTHWYPYLMRRMAERPANLWVFLGNLFRR